LEFEDGTSIRAIAALFRLSNRLGDFLLGTNPMALSSPSETYSSYYPPRARWWTRLYFGVGATISRLLYLNRIRLPGGLSGRTVLVSLLVPGFSFFASGRRLLGWCFLGAYLTSGLTFLATMGFFAGSIAYGLMISIHATSIVELERHWLRGSDFGMKVMVALCTLVAVWALIYRPMTESMERYWLIPLRIGERVIVVHRGFPSMGLQRGDRVAFRITGGSNQGLENGRIYLDIGFGVDPVLALPGDHVRFSSTALLVNGKPLPLAPHMPREGEFVLPQKVWFIWPNLGISRRGGIAEAEISAVIQRTAMVSQDQIIGRPFKYWFGRRQLQ
jgi:hypothetical protein